MAVTINAGWLVTTLLLSMRVAAATSVAAVFGPAQIPAPVRVVVALTLGALLAAGASTTAALPASALEFAAAAAGEVAIGAAFALGFLAAYAATQIAGRVLDIQMGFGVAAILNPQTQIASSLIGSILGMVAVAVFLGLDGHHVLIRALALSVNAFPPGGPLQAVDWSQVPKGASIMFGYGLMLAAPVMCALLLADLALAVFARSMPQLNIFVLGFALKIMLGVVGLAATVALSKGVFEAAFGALFGQWGRLAVGR
jgi:flagellar biosynthetic protein FliR